METTKQIVDFGAAGTIRQAAKYFAPKRGVAPSLVAGSSRSILSPTALEELFLYQRTANGAGGTGAAVFQSIKGNSIVWNQLASAKSGAYEWTEDSATFYRDLFSIDPVSIISGHKYLISAKVSRTISTNNFISVYLASVGINIDVANGAADGTYSAVCTASASASVYVVRVGNYSGKNGFNAGDSVSVDNFMLTDLTALTMPDLTAAQFNALYPGYHAPNPGAVKNNCATGMVTDGLNQWDEVWEEGSIDGTTGADTPNTPNIRSKNFIPIFPNTDYYFKTPTTLGLRFYDADKNYLGPVAALNAVKTSLNNARYLRFVALGLSTYANNICINLSGSRNGQYEPHWSDTTALPITTATGKLNGEGESVVLCPDGARSAGSAYDEFVIEKGFITKFIKRIGVVDLGDLTWQYTEDNGKHFLYASGANAPQGIAIQATSICSKYTCNKDRANIQEDKTLSSSWQDFHGATTPTIRVCDSAYSDADTFKTAMSGVMMNYELATPQLYVLDTPVPVVARVDENGTQTITPQGVDESGVPMTAPFAASIFYPEQMDKVYLTAADFKNFLDAAVEGGAITAYTMEWNAATGSYDFTVNQAAATLAAPASTE